MKTLTLLGLIGLAFVSLSRVKSVHQGRVQAKPAAKPEEVQTWEGEGGGLPTGGPGPGVKVSTPVTDPDLAHGGVGLAGRS
jgi:hypothetical protein